MEQHKPTADSGQPDETEDNRIKLVGEKLRKARSVVASQAMASAKVVKEQVQATKKKVVGSSRSEDERQVSEDVAHSGEDQIAETPKIAEKVKFWEEQDRINKELIPRVLKLHELFTEHVEYHEEVSTLIAGLEARYARRERWLMAVAVLALVIAAASVVLSLVV